MIASSGWRAAAFCAIALGCSSGTTNVSPAADAGAPETAPSCSAHETIELVSQRFDGAPAALYVPIEVGGKKGLLHLDSASWVTALFADVDGLKEDFATIRIGCRDLRVAGVGGLGTLPDVDGMPVLGMAGVDLLLAEPSLLDIDHARWIRNPEDVSMVRDGIDVPFAIHEGVVVFDATFDGKPVHAILDTGSASTVTIDETPRDGEVEYTTEDALGKPLKVYASSIELGLGGRTRTVPLLRAPGFYIVKTLGEQMHVELAGLIGLSSLHAIHFSNDRVRVAF